MNTWTCRLIFWLALASMLLQAVGCRDARYRRDKLALSQPPSPAPGKETENPQNTGADKQGDGAKNEIISKPPTPSTGEHGTPVAGEHGDNEGSRKKSQPPINWPVIGSIVNAVLTLIFAGALTWFSYGQWRATADQAKHMRKQSIYMRKEMKATKAAAGKQ